MRWFLLNGGCENKKGKTLPSKEDASEDNTKNKKISAKILNSIVKNKILELAKKMENYKNTEGK